MDGNIKVNKKELENFITKLETNNKTIVNTMNSIYEEMINIDDKEWHAPEKDRIDNEFTPYIKEQRDVTNTGLANNIAILRKALADYRELDENKLTKETENLEVL